VDDSLSATLLVVARDAGDTGEQGEDGAAVEVEVPRVPQRSFYEKVQLGEDHDSTDSEVSHSSDSSDELSKAREALRSALKSQKRKMRGRMDPELAQGIDIALANLYERPVGDPGSESSPKRAERGSTSSFSKPSIYISESSSTSKQRPSLAALQIQRQTSGSSLTSEAEMQAAATKISKDEDEDDDDDDRTGGKSSKDRYDPDDVGAMVRRYDQVMNSEFRDRLQSGGGSVPAPTPEEAEKMAARARRGRRKRPTDYETNMKQEIDAYQQTMRERFANMGVPDAKKEQFIATMSPGDAVKLAVGKHHKHLVDLGRSSAFEVDDDGLSMEERQKLSQSARDLIDVDPDRFDQDKGRRREPNRRAVVAAPPVRRQMSGGMLWSPRMS